MPNTPVGVIGLALLLFAVFASKPVDNPDIFRQHVIAFIIGIVLVAIDAYMVRSDNTTRLWRPGRRKCSNCGRWYTYNPKGLKNHWTNNPRYCPPCAKPKR